MINTFLETAVFGGDMIKVLDSENLDVAAASDPFHNFFERVQLERFEKRTGVADASWDAPLTAVMAKSTPIEVSHRIAKDDPDYLSALEGIRRRWAS